MGSLICNLYLSYIYKVVISVWSDHNLGTPGPIYFESFLGELEGITGMFLAFCCTILGCVGFNFIATV